MRHNLIAAIAVKSGSTHKPPGTDTHTHKGTHTHAIYANTDHTHNPTHAPTVVLYMHKQICTHTRTGRLLSSNKIPYVFSPYVYVGTYVRVRHV